MQRQFGTVSLFTSLISFAAAMLVCAQVQQADLVPGWRVSAPLLWTLESALYAMLVYGWQPAIGPRNWALAVFSFLLMRNLIGLASGLAVGASGGGAMGEIVARALANLPVRACAVAFTVMVAYPFRSLLPSRSRMTRLRERLSSEPQPGAQKSASGPSTFLLMGEPEERENQETKAVPGSSPLVAALEIEGSVAIPFGALLLQLPQQEEVQATAQGLDADFPVEVPLRLIVPQLREARLLIAASELAALLPSAEPWSRFSEYLRAASALTFSLPLPVVVPQLPPEVLALPPLPLPAWAKVEEDTEERLLFATV